MYHILASSLLHSFIIHPLVRHWFHVSIRLDTVFVKAAGARGQSEGRIKRSKDASEDKVEDGRIWSAVLDIWGLRYLQEL